MYFYVIVHRIFFITTYDVWNLNSPTRDQTRALESERYKFVSFKESIPPVHIILGNRSEQYGFLVLFLVLVFISVDMWESTKYLFEERNF